MKDETLYKCKTAVDWMLDNKVGIKQASKEWSISVGSIHSYIYNVLRFENVEKYDLVRHDMKQRYHKGRR